VLTVRLLAGLLIEAEPDLLVHFTFPELHRARIRSTNPLERLYKEIKRRTTVVGIFPNRASVIRLVGMILAEQDGEWQDGRRQLNSDRAPNRRRPVCEDAKARSGGATRRATRYLTVTVSVYIHWLEVPPSHG
jgi:hypothetical protein